LPLDRSALAHLFLGAMGTSLHPRLHLRTPSLTISVGDADARGGASESHRSAAMLPQPIAQPGPPRAMVTYGVQDGCVYLRFHETESVLLANDGTERPHHRWPRGIVGELPLGATGAVAWGNGRSLPDLITPGYVMYRLRAEDAPVVEELPFRPVIGSWCGERIFWSCLPSGAGGWTGLASWAPGAPPRKEIAGITTFDLHQHADGALILEPCARRADDAVERRLATMAWRWQPGSPLQPFPLGALGASSHRAELRGWTAVAYPHADTINLTKAGVALTIVCPSPFRLAWIDGDLIVSTLSLELWRFPHMIERLIDTDDVSRRTSRR
jgi:hypothetical protein